jgi:hypothetical protein
VVSGGSITVDGSTAPGLVIDGGQAVRPFVVRGTGSGLTLEDLTVQHGHTFDGDGDAGGGGRGVSATSPTPVSRPWRPHLTWSVSDLTRR